MFDQAVSIDPTTRSIRMRYMAIPSSMALLLSLAFATPAFAAAPTNDAYAGRTVIPSLPYTATLDTSEATTDAADVELNECGAPATDASVWYEFTAPVDMAVLVDVSASDYSAGVFVATGEPGAFGPIETCGPGAASFFAVGGTRYVVLVIDDQGDGGGNGGILELSVSEPPPPPMVDVTVEPTARFDSRTGSATLSGTLTCDEGAVGFVEISLNQSVGRFTISGSGWVEMPCDRTAQAWTAEIVGSTGLFKGGRAEATVVAWACDFDCGVDVEETTVRLRR
jgi:hypothetical protein